jgi:hypothetical protein
MLGACVRLKEHKREIVRRDRSATTEHLVDWIKLWAEEKKLDVRNIFRLRKAGFKAREL